MPDSRTVIGMLASHDSHSRNFALSRTLDYLVERHSESLKQFQFVVTKGTFQRVIRGEKSDGKPAYGVAKPTREFLQESCGIFRLPGRRQGGVVLLAALVVTRQISTLWPFLTPTTPHWLTPENLALLRLSDHWHTNRLMNEHSVVEWAGGELDAHGSKNRRPVPPTFRVGGIRPEDDDTVPIRDEEGCKELDESFGTAERREPDGTLALIAHDEMKSRIEEFVVDFQRELGNFRRIITTGTTGRIVLDAAPALGDRLRRYNSGPKGGDIEIAVEMIFGRCDVAVFLIDPLSPHPHNEDIRVLFGAAVLNGVRLLTNERQARAWMDRTGGNIDDCSEYDEWLESRERRKV